MRYMKARQGGGAVKTYIGKREGVAEKPIFAYQGGRGVKKQENPAYIVYGWSPTFSFSATRVRKCEV